MFDGYLVAGHALEIRRRSPEAILFLLTVSPTKTSPWTFAYLPSFQ